MAEYPLEWIRQQAVMNSPGTDTVPSIATDVGGNIYVAYQTTSVISGGQFRGSNEIVVLKMNNNGNVLWIKQHRDMNSPQDDRVPSIAVDLMGNCYITYQSAGPVSGGTFMGGSWDIVITKLDTNGNIVWITQNSVINSFMLETNPRIAVDRFGNCYISYVKTGTFSGGTFVGDGGDIVILKLDTSGNILWSTESVVINAGTEATPSICLDQYGNIYLSYVTSGTISGGTNRGSNDIAIAKMSTNGDIVWIKQQSLLNTTTNDFNPRISLDSIGNIYLSYGTSGAVSGGTFRGGVDIVISKMDNDGNVLWTNQRASINTQLSDQIPSIVVDSAGNAYISYYTNGTVSGGTNSGSDDIVVIQINTNGNINWIKQQRLMNTTSFDQTPSLALDLEDNLYVSYAASGTISGGTALSNDIVVMRFSANSPLSVPLSPTGVLALRKGSTSATISWIPTKTGGSVITGYTVTSNPGNFTATVSGSSLSAEVEGLTVGTTYTFRVTATNAIGTSNQSAPSPSYIHTSVPSAPTNVTAIDSGGAAATVSWIPGSDGASAITSYLVTSNPGNISVSVNGLATSAIVPGLKTGTYYTFSIRAININGASELSTESNSILISSIGYVLTWIKQEAIMNTTAEDFPSSIAVDNAGNSYIAYNTRGTVSGGTFIGSTGGGYDTVVLKMSSSGNLLWIKQQRLMNTTGSSLFPAISVDSVGNVYVSYYALSSVSGGTFIGGNDIVLFKMDTNGNVIFIKQLAAINTTNNDEYPDMAVDNTGNCFITYRTAGTVSGGENTNSGGSYDIVVLKTDTNGNVMWIRQNSTINTLGDDQFPSLALDILGNCYVTYTATRAASGGTFIGGNDIVVFKMDTNGNVVWIKQQALMNTLASDSYPIIATDYAGNSYVSYYTTGTVSGGTNVGSNDIVVFKIDTNGNVVWIKQQALMNTLASDSYPSIAVDLAGNCHIAYNTSGTVSGGTNRGSNDIVVLTMDTDGNVMTINQNPVINTTNFDSSVFVAVDASGNYYITYSSQGTVSGGTFRGSSDIVVVKLVTSSTYSLPSAPTNVTAIDGGEASAIVSWVPGDTGGAIISTYTVTSNPGNKTAIVLGSSTSARVSGLTTGVSYTFTVTPTNGVGTGAQSGPSPSLVIQSASYSMEWITQRAVMNTISSDLYPSIALDNSGNIYVSYWTSGTVSGGTFLGSSDIAVFKMDTNRNVLWVRQYAATNSILGDSYPTIAVDASGNCYVSYLCSGTVSGGTNLGFSDIVVFKLSTSGSIVWVRERAVMNTAGAEVYPEIAVDLSGNCYIAYHTSGTTSGGTLRAATDIVVLKMSTTGDIVWIRQQSIMNASNTSSLPSIAVDLSGNCYVSYYTSGTVVGAVSRGARDIVVFKMDTNGSLSWIKQQSLMNTTLDDTLQKIAVDRVGNVYVSYQTAGTVSGGVFRGTTDIVVFKLSTTGKFLWIKQQTNMNTAVGDANPSIAVDLAGDCFVAYQTLGAISGGTNRGSNDIVVFKIDANGNVIFVKQEPIMNTSSEDQYPQIAVDRLGNYYVTYQTTGVVSGGANVGAEDIVIMKYATSNLLSNLTVPAAPTNVTAVEGTDATAIVSWTPGNFGGSTVTQYTVTSNPGNISVSVGPSQTAIVGGLMTGVSYTFVVTAISVVGTSAQSIASNSVLISSVGHGLSWIKQEPVMNSFSDDLYPSIAIDISGNSYITYQTFGTVSGGTFLGGRDIVVLKMSTLGEVLWIKQQAVMNTTQNDQVYPSIAVDKTGNCYVSYYTAGAISGGTLRGVSDIVVFKMSQDGNIVWIKQQSIMNTPDGDYHPHIAIDEQGNCYISYSTNNTVSGGTRMGSLDIVVLKMDTNGNVVWIKQQTSMNTGGSNDMPAIAVDSLGNSYVSYRTTSVISGGTFMGGTDIVIFKMDTNGNVVWTRQQNLINTTLSEAFPSIATDMLGNCYVSYSTDGTISGGTNRGSNDIAILKMDTNGNILWIKQTAMNSVGNDTVPTIAVDFAGNCYVSYQTSGTISGGVARGSTDIAFVKLNTNGDIMWTKQQASVNTPGDDSWPSIGVDLSGNVYLSYYTNAEIDGGINIGTNDIVVMKFVSSVPLPGPSAPTNVTAVDSGDATATVSWTPGVNGTVATGYTVTSNPGNVSVSVGGFSTSAKLAGLITGVSYTFSVVGTNVIGASESSAPSAGIFITSSGYILSWIKQTALMNTASNDINPSVATDSLGNSYVAYSTNGTVSGGTNLGSNDIVLFKMDANGNVSWIRQYPIMNTSNNESLPSIDIDTLGNCYIVYLSGATVSGGTFLGTTDVVASKIDTNGNIVWIKQQAIMNTTLFDQKPRIYIDESSNCYVSYFTNGTVSGGTNRGSNDIVVFKMDTNGNLVWIRQSALTNTTGDDTNQSIAVDATGNVYISYQAAGTVSGGTNRGSTDIVIFKLDTNGNFVWIKQQASMNTTSNDMDSTIAVDSSSNVYVSYKTFGTVSGGMNQGSSDIVIFKMDTDGNIMWIKQEGIINTNSYAELPGIDVDTLGNIYVSYYTGGTVSGGTNIGLGDIVLLKLDTNGNVVWIKEDRTMNTIADDTFPAISVNSEGHIFVSYYTAGTVSGGTNRGSTDIVVMKFISSEILAKPSAPTDVTVVAYGTLGATVSWTPASSGDSPITSYIVTSTTGNIRILVNGSTTSTNVEGLIGGTTYTFRVTAISAVGAGEASIPSAPYTHLTAPLAPTSVAAVPIGLTTATLSWVPGSSGGSTITEYSITMNPGNVVTSVSGSSTSTTINDLIGGTTYTFVVTATNALGTSNPSSQLTYTHPSVPSAPTSVLVTPTGLTTATVSWTPGASGGSVITGYTVTSDSQTVSITVNGTTASVTGLTIGASYTFTVTAANVVGSSDPTTISYSHPVAPSPPTSVTAVDIGEATARISWTPGSDGGMALTSYTVTSTPGNFTATVSGSSTSAVIAGLTTGTSYTFAVTATSAIGTSEPSTSSTPLFIVSVSYPLAWIRQQTLMNTTGTDSFPSIATDSSGNSYVTYQSDGTVSGGTNRGSADVVVFKMDSNGTIVWIREQFITNTIQVDRSPTIAVDLIGNVYVSYYTSGTVSGGILTGSDDIVVFKMDTNGNVVWIRQQAIMNTISSDSFPTIAVDMTGNIYVSYNALGAVSGGTNIGSNDIVVFKMDTNGNVVWIRQRALMNAIGDDQTPKIAVDFAGNVYVSYYTDGTVSGGTTRGLQDIVLFKMDTNGNIVWVKQESLINTGGREFSPSVTVDIAGNLYVSYNTNGTISGGTNRGSNDIVVFKMNTNGVIVWTIQQTAMNTTIDDNSSTIAVDSVGDIYVSYRTTGTVSGGTNRGSTDIVLFKMDTSGSLLWIKQNGIMNTTGSDQSTTLALDSDGNIYISYSTDGVVSGGIFRGITDIVVLKFAASYALTAPLPPTIVSSVATGSTSASVSFVPSRSGGSVITGYTVTSNPGGFTASVSGTDRSATISGLTSGTSYTFTVTATNAIGTSDSSSGFAYTHPTVPSAPTSVTAVDIGEATVRVSWVPASDGGSPITGYTVTSSPGNITATVGNTATSATLSGLSSTVSYTFAVRAVNVIGNSDPGTSSSLLVSSVGYPLAWIRQQAVMNTTNLDTVSSIAMDAAGNIYVSYQTSGSVSGGMQLPGSDIVVFKMDTNGSLVWIRQNEFFNTNSTESSPAIAVDNSGNVYVSFNSDGVVSGGTNRGSRDIVVFKMDTNGNVVWIKQQAVFNTTTIEISQSIALDAAGNIYVSYRTDDIVSGGVTSNMQDVVVFKMDTNGNIVWIKQQAPMNTGSDDFGPTIAVNSAGNIYISYITTGTVSGGTRMGSNDVVVYQMDTNGNIVWIKQHAVMNTTANDQLPTIAVDAAGNVYISYQTAGTLSGGTNRGSSDIAVVKLDMNGNIVWIKQQASMNNTGNEQAPRIALDSVGNVFLSYFTDGAVSGGIIRGTGDIVICQMDTNGNIVWIKQQAIMNTTLLDTNPAIVMDAADNVYISYHTDGIVSGGSNIGSFDIAVMKFAASYPLSAPTPPTLSAVATGPSSATVTLRPGRSGGSAITGYTLTLNPGNLTSSVNASSPFTTITGLTSGQSYTLTATATNALGTSDVSNTFSYTHPTAPSAPTSVTAVDIGEARARISWTPASDGGSRITSYTVTSTPGSVTASVGYTDTSAIVTGLVTGISYTFTVTATNAIGSTTSLASPSLLVASVGYPLAWIKQQRAMNTSGNDQNPSIAVDRLGNSYVVYQTTGTVSGGTFFGGNNDIVIMKLDTNSNLVWINQQAILNTSGSDESPSIAVDGEGNCYVSYYTTGTVSGGTLRNAQDIVVLKMSTNGSIVWIKQQALMNAIGNDSYPKVVVDYAGSVYISYQTAGTVSGGTSLGNSDIVVLKIDTNGSVVWIKQRALMNSTGDDYFPSIAVDSAGNSYVAYVTTGTVSGGVLRGSDDIVVFKLDMNGTVVWIKEQSVVNTSNSDIFPSIAVDSLGNCYVSYTTSGTVSGGTFRGVTDVVTFKLDTNGSVIWVKQQAIANTTGDDSKPKIALDSANNCYVSYFTTGTVSGGVTLMGATDVVVLGMDSNGNMLWIKQQAVMNTGSESNPAISMDSTGNLYVTYSTDGTVSGGTYAGGFNDIVVMKFAASYPESKPLAPVGLTASASGPSSATVSWLPGRSGGYAIIGYTLTMNPGNLVTSVNGSTTYASVTGLVIGSVYTFTVTATSALSATVTDTLGMSDPSIEYAYTHPNVPSAPTSVNAVFNGLNGATVTWSPGATGGAIIESYTVTSSPGNFTATVLGSDTVANVVGVLSGVSYTFTVTAKNAVGTSDASSASPTYTHPTAPFAPTNVTAVDNGEATARVSWTAPSSNGGTAIISYTITSTPGNLTTTVSSPSTTGIVTGLTTGTSYTFAVVANNVIGASSAGTSSSIQISTVGYPLAWIKQQALMNTSVNENAPHMAVDSAGNSYITYTTNGMVSGGTLRSSSDVVVLKMDTTGNVVWIKQQALINGNGNYSPTIAVDLLSNCYIAYWRGGTVSGGTNSGSDDIVVFKMSSDGNIVWIKQNNIMNSTGSDSAPSIVVDALGNVYISYRADGPVSGGTNMGSTDTAIVKMDTNGNIVWVNQRAILNTAGMDDMSAIGVDLSGNSYIAYRTTGTISGGTNRGGATSDIAIVKLNDTGNVVWIKQQSVMNSITNDQYPSIAVDSMGNSYVTYETEGTISGGTLSGGTDVVVFKMDTDGNVVWIRQQALLNSISFDSRPQIAVDSVGDVYVTYYTSGTLSGGTNRGSNDIVFFKMSSAGNVILIKQESLFNTTANDFDPSIAVDSAGNLYLSYVTGGTVSGGTLLGGSDIVVVKFTATYPLTAPLAPLNLTAFANAPSSATFSWAPGRSGGSAITGYTVTSNPGNFTASVGPTTLSTTLTGLTSGVAYTFSVNATNAIGTGSTSQLAYTHPNVPSAPTGVTAVDIGEAMTRVSWTPGSNGGTAITSYTITSNPDSRTTTVSGVSTSGIITGLTTGVSYTFTVVANNVIGASASSSPSSSISISSVGYPLAWIKQQALMNTIANDNYPAIACDPAGNVYTAYVTTGAVSGGTNIGSTDVAIFKMDTDGNIVWAKQHRATNSTVADSFPAIAVDLLGNVYVTYQTSGVVSGGTNLGLNDIVVLKLDTNGNTVWVTQQAIANTIFDEQYPSIVADSSSNVYVCYQANGTISGGTNRGSNDIVVFKIDTNGNVMWVRQQAMMNTSSNDQIPVIAVDYIGNLYVSYFTSGTLSGGFGSGTLDIAVFKMDTNGNVVWIRQSFTLNTISADINPSMAVDSSGNVYVSYQTNGTVSGGTNSGSSDIVVFKLDTNSNIVWVKQHRAINSVVADSFPAIAVDLLGNVCVTYQTSGVVSGGTNRGANDIVLFQMDTNGNVLWVKEESLMNTIGDDSDPTIAVDYAGNLYISYSTTSTVSGGNANTNRDIVVMKFAASYPLTVPMPPTSVTAVLQGPTTATITWAPGRSGGSVITGYTVTSSSGGLTATVNGVTTSTTIQGLISDTTYTFTVTATNSLGTSAPSSPSPSYTHPNVPSAPTNVVAVEIGEARANVSWTASSSTGGTPITGYTVTANPGNMTVSVGPSVTSTIVAGLRTGSAYTFTVVATNIIGASSSQTSQSVLIESLGYALSWSKQQRIMNTTGSDVSPSIAVDGQGNSYVAYQTNGTVSGGTLRGANEIVVFKTDVSGNFVWIKQQAVMNTANNDNLPSIAVDGGGNCYVAYETTGAVSGGVSRGLKDIVVFKLDTAGNSAWIRQYAVANTGSDDAIPAIAADGAGNCYVSYQTSGVVSGGTNVGSTDIVVMKLATNGGVQWIKQQSFNTSSGDVETSIAVDSQGNSYVCYHTAGTVSGGTMRGTFDVVVFKMDSNGVLQWIKQQPIMNANGEDLSPSIAVDAESNCYVAYETSGTVSGGTLRGTRDIVVFKMSGEGVIQWIKQAASMNTSGADTSPSIAVDRLGNSYIAYKTDGSVSGGSNVGTTDIVLMKMDMNGNMMWIKQSELSTSGTDQSPSVAVDPFGNCYVAYDTTGAISGASNAGSNDIVIVRYASSSPLPPSEARITGAIKSHNRLRISIQGNMFMRPV